jgi:hypothetical protein
MTFDTGAYLTITAGWPEGHLDQRYTLPTISGLVIPILKEIFLTLTFKRLSLKILVFVSSITDEFILGMDILRPYDASAS